MKSSHLHLDFETRSTVDLRAAGADVYARHESTDIWCMAYAFDDEPVSIAHRASATDATWVWKDSIFDDVTDFVRSGGTVVAHNCPFELAIWNHVATKRYGWPPLRPEQTFCTMATAYAMALPGSLDNASAAAGLNMKKDMEGYRTMLQLSQPRRIEEDGTVVWWDDETKFQRLLAYCKHDVEIERALHKRLMTLSPAERAAWLLDYKINQRGVQVDLKAVKTAIQLVEIEKERLDREMRAITDNGVGTCTATTQLTQWLRLRGCELDGVAKDDVLKLLDSPTLSDDCRKALILRQEAAKSSTAKLESMLNSACDDERIRGIFQYHGATTGRWAGRRIQPQNFPRPKLSRDEIENVFGILGKV